MAVAAITVPTAPLLKVTVLSRGEAANPKPLITIVALLAAKLAELLVMTGITLATWTAAPLETLLVVTIAVSAPERGFTESVTVSAVEVALVTAPTAPLLNVTVLLAAVLWNPVPLIVTVDVSADRFEVTAVIVGATTATCTAVPLEMELVVTTAVRLPAEGLVPKVTVSDVAEAAVTVPTAPLLKATELLAATGSKARPLMTNVFAEVAKAVALNVTAGVTRATCVAAPLERVLEVTTAVRLPDAVGAVVKRTLSVVAVAAVTVPAAPLLNVTTLFEATGSNPKPLIVKDVARAARSAELLVTTGVTIAT